MPTRHHQRQLRRLRPSGHHPAADMQNPTPRGLRNAVIITAIVAAVVTIALLDPSCRPRSDIPHEGPIRSLAPR
jgi:hypothetical protein